MLFLGTKSPYCRDGSALRSILWELLDFQRPRKHDDPTVIVDLISVGTHRAYQVSFGTMLGPLGLVNAKKMYLPT